MLEYENAIASYCKGTSTLQFTDVIIILLYLTANQVLCTNYSDNCEGIMLA